MSDYLPEELIQKILLKLPIKHVIKCTSVCKSWMLLIKSPSFIQSHLQNDAAHPLLLLLSSKYGDDNQDLSLRWDTPGALRLYSNLSIPVNIDENGVSLSRHIPRVAGTCNGLVYLHCGDSAAGIMPSPFLIWNPSIRKAVMLPSPPTTCSCAEHAMVDHGFAFDAHSNDYKILRIVSGFKRYATSVHVFSLARGTWNNLSASAIPPYLGPRSGKPVFVNGSLHMLRPRTVGGVFFIITFNMATEVFGEIATPKAERWIMERQTRRTLLRYKESLALINHDGDWNNQGTYGCYIWVMQEYGVAESWTLLFNIDLVPFQIYGFGSSGELVLSKYRFDNGGTELVWVDPQSKQVNLFQTEDHDLDQKRSLGHYFMDYFVESLVLLDRSDAFIPIYQ